MQLYVHKNNEQTGPFDEDVVLRRLRSGELSPNDLGFRQGDAGWTRLGDIFAGRIDEPAAFGTASAAAASSPAAQNFAPAPAVKRSGSGCRVALGWLMLIFGMIMCLGGITFAVVTPYIYNTVLCDMADQDKKEVDELMPKYEAAKRTPDDSDDLEIQFELERALDSFKATNEMCGEALATRRMYQVGAGAVAFFGFVIAIIGFFVRRVRGG